MWKIVLIYIGVSLSLFCSPLKGKEVLDKIIKEREKAKGNEIVSYEINNVDKSDSTQNIFYITATVIKNARTKEVKDTIHIYTTRDGILIDVPK